jgi:hypothetical protein
MRHAHNILVGRPEENKSARRLRRGREDIRMGLWEVG